MPSETRKCCYGSMFPTSFAPIEAGSPRTTALAVVAAAPVGLQATPPRIEVNHARWDECRLCADFDDCYKLSMARLTLATAVGAR